MGVGHHRTGRLSAAEEAHPQAKKRLGIMSIAMIAVGLGSVVHLLATGKGARRSATDTSGGWSSADPR